MPRFVFLAGSADAREPPTNLSFTFIHEEKPVILLARIATVVVGVGIYAGWNKSCEFKERGTPFIVCLERQRRLSGVSIFRQRNHTSCTSMRIHMVNPLIPSSAIDPEDPLVNFRVGKKIEYEPLPNRKINLNSIAMICSIHLTSISALTASCLTMVLDSGIYTLVHVCPSTSPSGITAAAKPPQTIYATIREVEAQQSSLTEEDENHA